MTSDGSLEKKRTCRHIIQKQNPYCPELFSELVCTEEYGHEGDHIARDTMGKIQAREERK